MIGKTLEENMTVSPQIRPEDVAELREQGVEIIINNRPDGEEPGQPTSDEIEAAAKEHGIDYVHMPVTRGPSHADVEAMQDVLRECGGRKIHAFCRSGTRSALTWAIARSEEGAEHGHVERCLIQAGYDPQPIAHLL